MSESGQALTEKLELLHQLEADPKFAKFETENTRLNPFTILGIERREIRHSNMLAWLFDPKGSHGMGDAMLRGLIDFLVKSGEKQLDYLLREESLEDFAVYREWNYLDILIVSTRHRCAIAIENKIDTDEHPGPSGASQLVDYRKQINKHFGDYTKCFLFLTRDGYPCSQPKIWKSIDYNRIFFLLKKRKRLAATGAQGFIENYLDILKRYIVENAELKRECMRIYLAHREAIDLIMENIDTGDMRIRDLLEEFLKEKKAAGEVSDFVMKPSAAWFQTPVMDIFLPNRANVQAGPFGNCRCYIYAIEIKGNLLDGRMHFCPDLISRKQNKPLRGEKFKKDDAFVKVYDALADALEHSLSRSVKRQGVDQRAQLPDITIDMDYEDDGLFREKALERIGMLWDGMISQEKSLLENEEFMETFRELAAGNRSGYAGTGWREKVEMHG